MELSSITHIMDETFAYKLDNHKYLIKIVTKKNDIKGIKIAYLEKYFREKDMPGIPSTTFYLDMKKVASTEENDYYEAIVSDQLLMMGVTEKVDEILKDKKNVPPFFVKMAKDIKEMEGKTITMLSLSYYFVLEGENERKYYGNYKFFDQEPTAVLDMFNLVIHQANASYFQTPEWSKGAIVYQIFPERFAPTNDLFSHS